MAEPVLREKDGDVTIITLNRPEAGNRQTDATWAQVTDMFDAAAKDSRAIVFKGAGDDFCLGREAMGAPGPVLEAYSVRERSETIFNLYGAFRKMAHRIMPTIAFSALVDRLSRKAATYMIYSTEEVDAQTALAYGLVSNVVPAR